MRKFDLHCPCIACLLVSLSTKMFWQAKTLTHTLHNLYCFHQGMSLSCRAQTAAAMTNPNAAQTLAASQSLQEACARGLSTSTEALIQQRQSQNLFKGPIRYQQLIHIPSCNIQPCTLFLSCPRLECANMVLGFRQTRV